MYTIICFHQQDNLHTLHAISTLKPDCIELIYNTDLPPYENLYDFQHYLESKSYKVRATQHSLSASMSLLLEHIDSVNSPKALLLPTMQDAFSYNLLLSLATSSLRLLSTDDDGTIFERRNNRFEPLPIDYSLKVSDLIRSRGGRIDMSSTIFFDSTLLIELLTLIEDHLDDYYQLFRYSMKPPFYETSREEPRQLQINTTDIAAKHMPFFNRFIHFLQDKNIARVTRLNKHQYRILFIDKRYKSYLLKSGTWLEHRLYLLFKALGFQDVEASIAFLWDKDYPRAKNECDVMGMYYNRLYMASCKDTHHLSPDYINELYANANHLAQSDVRAILFTTAKLSPGIQEKADEFNITLVTYDGHMTKGYLDKCRHLFFNN